MLCMLWLTHLETIFRQQCRAAQTSDAGTDDNNVCLLR